MLARWLIACAIGMSVPTSAAAQPDPLPPALQTADPLPDQSVSPPVNIPPSGPPFEFRPLGLWWFNTSVELGWMSNRPSPQTLRLKPPDLFGNPIPGLILGLNGQSSPSFQAGMGIQLGRWLDPNQTNALELGAYIFPGSTRSVSGFAPGTFVFFPNGTDQSAPLMLQFPAPLSGFGSSFPARASSIFASIDANFRAGLLITDNARLDLLVGYRFAYLEDDLYLGAEPAPDHNEFKQNRLTVENAFHGGQLGLDADYRAKNWYASGNVKLAYGAVTTKSAASGAFLFSETPVQYRADSHSAFLPSCNFRLGYKFSDTGSVFVGYNFLYLNRASRFGDALTSGTNPLTASEFWVQSVSLGLDWRY